MKDAAQWDSIALVTKQVTADLPFILTYTMPAQKNSTGYMGRGLDNQLHPY